MKKLKRESSLFIIALTILFLNPLLCIPAFALQPHEILVLANSKDSHSIELSRYYMKKRGIPDNNLIRLRTTDKEWCGREEYEKNIALPVRDYIVKKDTKRHIRCILIMYGLPLKILGSEKKGSNKKTDGASLDSEIALVLEEGYSLVGWQPNPFFVGYGEKYEKRRDYVLIVSRLDGPSEGVVRRMIDDSIAIEESGLEGNAYFDARWPRSELGPEKASARGYDFYDHSIHLAADIVKQSGLMPVALDDKSELFQPGDCPDAALYCGWYSLAEYIDAFEWRPGSVGYHIASGECRTLKEPGSRVWCKKMIEKGIAATLGPVSEPYVQAFPVPELFFRFLLDGYWTISECYALSQPFWSWQMVLIGDPLYRPFKSKRKKEQ